MGKVGIVSVIYLEPEWQQTRESIVACDVPTHYVDRQGRGSLAKSHNVGFRKLLEKHPDLDYVWFITNPKFDPAILPKLVEAMDETGYDCIHPAFDSDHLFCRPDGSGEIKAVPFVEFTAPIVKVDTFKKYPLDEYMPYWGHDFDFGYKVRSNGGVVAVHHGITVEHIYIRNNVNARPHYATTQRHELRRKSNRPTHKRLEQVYGKAWRHTLQYFGK